MSFRFCFNNRLLILNTLLLIIYLFPFSISAQVFNIDREDIEDSVQKNNWQFFCTVGLSSDKQKNNIVDINSNIELAKNFSNKYVFASSFRNDAIFNGPSTIQNEGLLHVKYRDRDTRKLSPEAFLQYQWNGAWGMEFRTIYGGNLRYKLFDKKGLDLYGGLGCFYEQEKWNWNGVKNTALIPADPKAVLKDRWRLNNYFKFAYKASSIVDIASSSYLQFQLNDKFFEPRWYFELNTFINAGEHLSFNIHWDHIMDYERPVPIESFYYSLSFGIQIRY